MSDIGIRIKQILVCLICLGFFAAGCISWERYRIENQATTVEMVYDYKNIMDTAAVSKKTEDEVFNIYKNAGITSLAIYDETPERLINAGLLRVYRGADLLAKKGINAKVQTDKIYIQPVETPLGERYFRETDENLSLRMLPNHLKHVSLDGIDTIEVHGHYNEFLKMPLGIYQATVDSVTGHGFYAVLRPANVPHITKEIIERFFKIAGSSDKVTGVLFQGKEVFGFPDYVEDVSEELQKIRIPLGVIEAQNQLGFERQSGLMDMAKKMDYDVVRLYAMSKDELIKINETEAASRFYVSDIERNIRMNLFPSYKFSTQGETLAETNARYISDVRERLLDHGFHIGRASVMETYFPGTILRMAVILGAVSLSVLSLLILLPALQKWWIPIEIFSVLIALGLFGISSSPLILQVLGLGSAITIPLIVMSLFLDYCVKRKESAYQVGSMWKIFVEAFVLLWVMGLISLVGATYISGLLGDTRFFLEMEIFRGVKLTFVMPLILVSLLYIRKFPFFGQTVATGDEFVAFVRRFCGIPVKIGVLMIILILGAVAFLFVGRSGNNGAPVPQFEVSLRRFFEQIMYARPRQKEFLFGHPAVFLSLVALYKKWPQFLHYLLILAVTIGQGSIVETFAHMRSPFILSIVRGINGLLMGSVTMIGAIIFVIIITRLTKFFGERYGRT